jgi:hypothetical protein
MNSDQVLRAELLRLLQGGHAHMDIDQAAADFPVDSINVQAPNVPYTPWHLLEHIRITQWDILEFVRDPRHVSPQWPKEYWPDPAAKTDEAHWKATLEGIRSDLRALVAIVQDPTTDFFGPIPHAKDYNILREILLVADHNAYHIGEFGILRQVMGTWPKG